MKTKYSLIQWLICAIATILLLNSCRRKEEVTLPPGCRIGKIIHSSKFFTSYEYDRLGRLIKTSLIEGKTVRYWEAFEYDNNGLLSKRTQLNPMGDKPNVFLYEWESPQRLKTVQMGDITRTFKYDARHRIIQTSVYENYGLPSQQELESGNQFFEYDGYNNLVSVKSNEGQVQMLYVEYDTHENYMKSCRSIFPDDPSKTNTNNVLRAVFQDGSETSYQYVYDSKGRVIKAVASDTGQDDQVVYHCR